MHTILFKNNIPVVQWWKASWNYIFFYMVRTCTRNKVYCCALTRRSSCFPPPGVAATDVFTPARLDPAGFSSHTYMSTLFFLFIFFFTFLFFFFVFFATTGKASSLSFSLHLYFPRVSSWEYILVFSETKKNRRKYQKRNVIEASLGGFFKLWFQDCWVSPTGVDVNFLSFFPRRSSTSLSFSCSGWSFYGIALSEEEKKNVSVFSRYSI